MDFRRLVQDKVVDRYRQFGGRAATTQIFKRLLAPIHEKETFWILTRQVDTSHTGQKRDRIVPITAARVEHALARNEISVTEAELFRKFLHQGSTGVFAVEDEQVAGWAWLQFRGVYEFGNGGAFVIPDGGVVFNTDFIRRHYRGRGLANEMTLARLEQLSYPVMAISFVLAENRYSLRYYERSGFSRTVRIVRRRWLGRPWQTFIRVERKAPWANEIVAGFNSTTKRDLLSLGATRG